MEQAWGGSALMIGRSQETDVGLVLRARSGDRAAFDALVRGSVVHVYRTALAILGSEADAADATQEAFVSAWRAMPRLRDADLFDAWLARIALNSCRQQLRRRTRVQVHEIRIADDSEAGPAAERPDERTAEADRFDRAFARLSADERAVLVFHHLEERSVAEIATVLGVAQGTIKSRLHRARAALESALAKESR